MGNDLKLAYIAIEGVDGVGKTTLWRALGHALESVIALPRQIVPIREPSPHHQLGEWLCNDANLEGVSADRLRLAFHLNRVHQCEDVVAPLEGQPAIILSDRCFLSSVVYQGDLYRFEAQFQLFNQMWSPDRILYLFDPTDESGARRDHDAYIAALDAWYPGAYHSIDRTTGWSEVYKEAVRALTNWYFILDYEAVSLLAAENLTDMPDDGDALG